MRSFLQRLHFPFYWYMNPFIRATARLDGWRKTAATRGMTARIVFLILFLLPIALSAQHFGGNPPSLKWHQINTDTVRIIFPAGLETQGQRVANIVHYLNRNTRTSIGNRQQKVDIVLQNQTLESNGYVMLGPFRSEFYLSPPPSSLELGSLKWEEQLALHEYRHVLQNMNFRQGISKVFSILGGQLGQAAVTNIAVPNWFWEGDAVTMETALSHQGRGRLPAFFDGFRGLTLDKRNYSYMKIRNGSYRDYIPDHYELGYLMSVYGRNHYGQTFWRDVTTDAVRFRGVFYPCPKAYSGVPAITSPAFIKPLCRSTATTGKRMPPGQISPLPRPYKRRPRW